MTDTLDFVKNLWGSMSVPGLTAPTLSVDELDKKINDLKAVETWLNLNMSMLRGSIQALEVQRGTIATLKSVGASMAAAVNQGGGDTKSLLDTVPYASVFFQQAAQAAAPAKAPVKEAPPAPAASAPPATAAAPKPAASPNTDAAAQMANPAVWWNLLQDQFKQAVSSTLGPEAMSNAGKMAAAATAAATSVAKSAANAATAATAAKPKVEADAPKTAAKAPAKAAAKPRAVKAKPAAKPSAQ
jgi:hypothetical protein